MTLASLVIELKSEFFATTQSVDRQSQNKERLTDLADCRFVAPS